MGDKWKFWKRKETDQTEISVTEADLSHSRQIYVKAQTSEKAFELYEKLKEEKGRG